MTQSIKKRKSGIIYPCFTPIVTADELVNSDIRRNKQCVALSRLADADDQHTLHDTATSVPGRKRLQSHHPLSEQFKHLTSDAHGKTYRAWAEGTWKTRWDTKHYRFVTWALVNRYFCVNSFQSPLSVFTNSYNHSRKLYCILATRLIISPLLAYTHAYVVILSSVI